MDYKNKIKEIVANQLGVNEEEITNSTTFADVNADSLDVVEVIMAIESEFDIELADDEVEELKSIGDLTDYVVRKI